MFFSGDVMVCVRGSKVGCWLACVSVVLLLVLVPVRGYEESAAAAAPHFAAEQLPWAGLDVDAQPPRPFDTLLYFPRQVTTNIMNQHHYKKITNYQQNYEKL